jgi:hypothetical protein
MRAALAVRIALAAVGGHHASGKKVNVEGGG